MLVTRLAPTPSGYLHVGNAANLVLGARWARRSAGRLLLRIDDFDAGRIRPAYVRDVFDTLAWLGISWDDGPRDPADLAARWTTARWAGVLQAARDRLLREHPDDVFVCRCSRRELGSDGTCRAGCRAGAVALAPGSTAVRLHVAPGTAVTSRHAGPLTVPAGDHVLWRRDDLPAYQLGSVVLDEHLGVTAVVRGTDLTESTALQLHLAGLLPAPGFLASDIRHHALLTAPDGTKLSKSAGARATPLPRTAALRRHVEELADRLGEPIGLGPGDAP